MKKVVAVLILIVVAVSLTACKGREPVSFEELLSPYNAIGHVRARDVESIPKGTTYREIITRLGATQDLAAVSTLRCTLWTTRKTCISPLAIRTWPARRVEQSCCRVLSPSSTRVTRSASGAS